MGDHCQRTTHKLSQIIFKSFPPSIVPVFAQLALTIRETEQLIERRDLGCTGQYRSTKLNERRQPGRGWTRRAKKVRRKRIGGTSSVTVSRWHRHHLSPFSVSRATSSCPSLRGGTLNLAATRGDSTRVQCETTILSSHFLRVLVSKRSSRLFSPDSKRLTTAGISRHDRLRIAVHYAWLGKKGKDQRGSKRGNGENVREGGLICWQRDTCRRMAYSWDNRVDFIVRFLYG